MEHKYKILSLFLFISLGIACSTFLVFFAPAIKKSWKRGEKGENPTHIKAIVQTGPIKEGLKTAYLAQLLDLSCDQLTLAETFDVEEGKRKLFASGLIKQATLKVKEGGILYIDYTLRTPIAFLADFENVALDREGFPHLLSPFFTPKKLPKIYLGVEEVKWNHPLSGKKKDLAFTLLDLVTGPVTGEIFNVVSIDVSRSQEKSYGRREIIVQTEDVLYLNKGEDRVCVVFPMTLRLSTNNYRQELSNYLKLRDKLFEKEKKTPLKEGEGRSIEREKIIDLRIPQLAFIEEK